MRKPLTLPKEFAVRVLTGYVPLELARAAVDNPQSLHIRGGREVIHVLPAGPGKVTIQ